MDQSSCIRSTQVNYRVPYNTGVGSTISCTVWTLSIVGSDDLDIKGHYRIFRQVRMLLHVLLLTLIGTELCRVVGERRA